MKEKEVDDIAEELREINHGKHSYSDPQYKLWARMIINGLHSSKEVPPQVPMMTGVTPTRSSRKSLEVRRIQLQAQFLPLLKQSALLTHHLQLNQ
jgi:hypothetical protein